VGCELVDLGLPELTEEQIEEICAAAEDAAKKLVLSKVNQKQIDRLDIVVEAEGTRPINFAVEVNLVLTSQSKATEQKELVKQAVKEAFEAIENCLSKLK
jgi:ribosome-associated translation inhibitor RaiA